ncbi:galactokinase [Cyclobacterium xiamenense]|uniref:Galactokinase n=1 Tax=Cyclobacterium xiamenense TaxID=1297121 RepID=A0A1H6XNG5_9BACT|nr:galactokinase [Cyclobacterium xiamenense]SEJ28307.1 galactokinase [Cyclobacterium xiamenense]
MSLPQLIRSTFLEKYGSEPLLIRSPGRINLIGEHTDYNEGFVLPAAIDKYIYLGFAKNASGTCRIYSLDFEEEQIFTLEELKPRNGWINFVMGVAAQFVGAGYVLEGFDCVFGGDIPIGAGLSSSAALENGVGLGLSELFALRIEKLDLVRYSQQAEHDFAGVKCGIMDMFASMMGKKEQALRLDCRSLDFAYFPVDLGNYQWLLCDSGVSHSLADSAYNKRREECRQGVALVQAHHPNVSSLRDVDAEQLKLLKDQLPGTVFRRCSYVIQENERVIQSCEALEQNDLDRFGAYLYRSHEGLSQDYEVSCPELDFLVDFTRDLSEVAGSRMMGGGFGGCTLNLVKKSASQFFTEKISAAYQNRFGIQLKAYEVNVVDGTKRHFLH